MTIWMNSQIAISLRYLNDSCEEGDSVLHKPDFIVLERGDCFKSYVTFAINGKQKVVEVSPNKPSSEQLTLPIYNTNMERIHPSYFVSLRV